MIKRKILQVFREEKTDYPKKRIIRMTELSSQQPELLKENREAFSKYRDKITEPGFHIQSNQLSRERARKRYFQTYQN